MSWDHSAGELGVRLPRSIRPRKSRLLLLVLEERSKSSIPETQVLAENRRLPDILSVRANVEVGYNDAERKDVIYDSSPSFARA